MIKFTTRELEMEKDKLIVFKDGKFFLNNK